MLLAWGHVVEKLYTPSFIVRAVLGACVHHYSYELADFH